MESHILPRTNGGVPRGDLHPCTSFRVVNSFAFGNSAKQRDRLLHFVSEIPSDLNSPNGQSVTTQPPWPTLLYVRPNGCLQVST